MHKATLARNSTDAILDVLQNHQADDIISVSIAAEDSIDGTRFNVYAVEVVTQAVADGEGEMPMK